MDLRKLDALVAEHIMGLWVHRIQIKIDGPKVWIKRGNGPVTLDPPEVRTIYQCASTIEGYPRENVPHYSSSMDDVMGVLLRSEILKYGALFQDSGSRWGIGKWSNASEMDGERIFADSVPLVICVAALKDKGIDVSEWEVVLG